MKIIIIGCGKVGYALAEELTEEKHEVTIIDSSSERLQEVEEELDALQILGNGSSLSVLMEADIKNTEPMKTYEREKGVRFDLCDRFR